MMEIDLSILLFITLYSAKQLVIDILITHNVSQEKATTITEALVLADVREVDTHGINRLMGYINRLTAGVLDPNPNLSMEMKTPVIANWIPKSLLNLLQAS